MFILLFVIAVVLIVLVVLNKDLAEGFGILLGGLIGFIALIGIFVNIGFLVHGRTLDDKIAMYEQENTAIEQSVDVRVKD